LQEAPFLSASNNRLCNGASKPFFAIVTYHLRNLLNLGCGQPLGHALAARGVHAHVQRAVETKTETPSGLSIWGELTPRSISTPAALPGGKSPRCENPRAEWKNAHR
jgi:hypothetical protein